MPGPGILPASVTLTIIATSATGTYFILQHIKYPSKSIICTVLDATCVFGAIFGVVRCGARLLLCRDGQLRRDDEDMSRVSSHANEELKATHQRERNNEIFGPPGFVQNAGPMIFGSGSSFPFEPVIKPAGGGTGGPTLPNGFPDRFPLFETEIPATPSPPKHRSDGNKQAEAIGNNHGVAAFFPKLLNGAPDENAYEDLPDSSEKHRRHLKKKHRLVKQKSPKEKRDRRVALMNKKDGFEAVEHVEY